MKKLLVLIFSILISFNTYGEWILVTGDDIADGYIETDTITKQNEYVYFWILQNKHTRDKYGTMSAKIYTQGDCGINKNNVSCSCKVYENETAWDALKQIKPEKS